MRKKKKKLKILRPTATAAINGCIRNPPTAAINGIERNLSAAAINGIERNLSSCECYISFQFGVHQQTTCVEYFSIGDRQSP
ncbi:hypothetical protein KP509_28G054500 [Ceratopteris richardii]|uniref:Uncharacterized protein n=1 Tax=Ceratopteris richardii TaxID=49495 RepID=A0A8T2RC79_CERRI|nr:hypothetical protein KP509_28G054500 [Ceratopteris richardii]